jgi:hypothetical protein
MRNYTEDDDEERINSYNAFDILEQCQIQTKANAKFIYDIADNLADVNICMGDRINAELIIKSMLFEQQQELDIQRQEIKVLKEIINGLARHIKEIKDSN